MRQMIHACLTLLQESHEPIFSCPAALLYRIDRHEPSRDSSRGIFSLAPLAAVAAYSLQNVLPWMLVQFGGMAIIIWLATLPRREGHALNL